MAFQHSLSTNNYGESRIIVAPSAANGTHTTIALALADAVSGDTIFIRDGTYTQDINLKAGVNLCAWTGNDQSSQVTIIGKCSMTTAGTVVISNIRLQTNGDYFLQVSGSAASAVFLRQCYLACTNNTGISSTSSSADSRVEIVRCDGDISTTGITLYEHNSVGELNIHYTFIFNSGLSTTNSTAASGDHRIFYSKIKFPITTSANCVFVSEWSDHDNEETNSTSITHGGHVNSRLDHGTFRSGTATAISISTTLFVIMSDITTSNTNAISGAGTIIYTGLSFSGTTSNISVTTQTLRNWGPSIRFGSTNSGNTNTLTSFNTSNTASSGANIISSVAGATAADPTYQATVAGVTTWTWGIDNDPAADTWVLAQGTALGTNNVISAATSGEINYPLQPAFMAYLPSNVNNVTGNGATFILGTTTALTEVFDQGGDFVTSGTFTAPVTGRYQLNAVARLTGCTIATNFGLNIVTSNRLYAASDARPASSLDFGINNSFLCDMDAGDTAFARVVAFGEAGDTDDLIGNATDVYCGFSGYLVA